ncbi:MAG: L,D-transpeptidase family protein [Akkermansiaceae bacterium]
MNQSGKSLLTLMVVSLIAIVLSSCGNGDHRNSVVVSVKDQKMLLIEEGEPVKIYPISTSKFGLGSQRGSNRTPLGKLEVARKIGRGAPSGAVFKSRKRTGEVLKPNAPGRDPIVTRIIWLHGKQRHNKNSFGRYIYIHGTPEESRIGHPASYGCIRMKSRHIIDLYRRLAVGSKVRIVRGSLFSTRQGRAYAIRKEGHAPVAGN